SAAHTDSRFTGTGMLNVTTGPASFTSFSNTTGDPVVYGTPVRLTVSVIGSGPTPTGAVTFKDGTTLLGSVPLDSAGNAVFFANGLDVPGSPHAIVVSYSGDNNFNPSSQPGSVSVTPATL